MKEVGRKFCYNCNKRTKAVKPAINHILHLLLSVFMLGIWLIVWAILGIRQRIAIPTCDECGKPFLHDGRAENFTKNLHQRIKQ